MRSLFAFILGLNLIILASAFATISRSSGVAHRPVTLVQAKPPPKISKERRKQLGINDDEDEYDLYFALDKNTDPFITKLIAGSLIFTIFGLLIAGVVIPSLTDYGEGVCNPLLTGGRC